MDSKQIALSVALVTVLVNCILAFSGITHTVSCTVASGVANAYAAVAEVVAK